MALFFSIALNIWKVDLKMFENVSDEQMLRSMLAETAKANNEIRCAQADLDKAKNRLGFLVMLTNKLIDRKKE
jgi:hypothetical protein